MILGIFFGLMSGAFWGLSFVLPKWIDGVPAEWVGFGRFVVFGIFSFFVLLWKIFYQNHEFKTRFSYTKMLFLSLSGYSFYYFLLVLSIQKIGITLPSLIIGILPVTTGFFGQKMLEKNEIIKSTDRIISAKLVLAWFLIIAGIIFSDFSGFQNLFLKPKEQTDFIFGTFLSFVCLGLWTYYSVQNSIELKKHPKMSAATWTSATGVGTVLASGFFLLCSQVFFGKSIGVEWGALLHSQWFFRWVLVSVVLGLGAGWLAIFFWNQACKRLSAQLAGQLIVSETIFGVLYGLIYAHRWPNFLEILGILFLICGVLWSVRILARRN